MKFTVYSQWDIVLQVTLGKTSVNFVKILCNGSLVYKHVFSVTVKHGL